MLVADIEIMGRDMLRDKWKALNSKPAPYRISTPFMRQVLAYEIQAQQGGGLSKAFRKRLKQAASKKISKRSNCVLPIGTRLIREWNGINHVVEAIEHGFQWQGATYRSLSAIARTITGTHWSGPRFFGLTGVKTK